MVSKLAAPVSFSVAPLLTATTPWPALNAPLYVSPAAASNVPPATAIVPPAIKPLATIVPAFRFNVAVTPPRVSVPGSCKVALASDIAKELTEKLSVAPIVTV